jgi:hypothetical protein
MAKGLVIDIELTLNRFGFTRVTENKIQFLFFRISWIYSHIYKYAISFEVNWKIVPKLEVLNGQLR